MRPQIDINRINDIVIGAGNRILSLSKEYFADSERSKFVELAKEANLASYQYILEQLSHTPYQYPILSEESGVPDYEVRKNWDTYWVIDPLDGRNELEKQKDEYTVSMALIHRGFPVLGVIYLPAFDWLYFADDNGAYKCTSNKSPHLLKLEEESALKQIFGVISRYYKSRRINKVLEKVGAQNISEVSSALKFCMIAEGLANLHYRDGEIEEWDVAAGQALIERSGGRVIDRSNERCAYNQPNPIRDQIMCVGFLRLDPEWYTVEEEEGIAE